MDARGHASRGQGCWGLQELRVYGVWCLLELLHLPRMRGTTESPRPESRVQAAGLTLCWLDTLLGPRSPLADTGRALLQPASGGERHTYTDGHVRGTCHLRALFHCCLLTVTARGDRRRKYRDDDLVSPGPAAAKHPRSKWTRRASRGLCAPCTTKFTACRSACARSCGSRSRILGRCLLLPMTDTT